MFGNEIDPFEFREPTGDDVMTFMMQFVGEEFHDFFHASIDALSEGAETHDVHGQEAIVVDCTLVRAILVTFLGSSDTFRKMYEAAWRTQFVPTGVTS